MSFNVGKVTMSNNVAMLELRPVRDDNHQAPTHEPMQGVNLDVQTVSCHECRKPISATHTGQMINTVQTKLKLRVGFNPGSSMSTDATTARWNAAASGLFYQTLQKAKRASTNKTMQLALEDQDNHKAENPPVALKA